MIDIKLAQYANEEQTLYYIQYVDDSEKYVSLNDGTEESLQLGSFVRGNTVGDFQPIISGGIIPIATIMWFCSTRAPEGYLVCDGSAVSRIEYTQLFRSIGELYGSGNGQTTFNLPNLTGRFCRGWGPVSPLDPTRSFGSYQEDGVGLHNHGLQPVVHTHTITDPTHFHGVTDPGHDHPIVDFGHNHTVTDAGHQHTMTTFSHTGYAAAYDIFFNGAIQFGSGGLFYGYFYYNFSPAAANMQVAVAPANLVLLNAQANVIAGSAFTGVSIDVATVNIPDSEITGDSETRPDNIALLPVIRY